jgi:hypothetical protein
MMLLEPTIICAHSAARFPPASRYRKKCIPKGSVLDNPTTKALLVSEDTLSTDLANISDPTATKDAGILEGYVTVALYNSANNREYVTWTNAQTDYIRVVTRCGQLIQGQS